MSDTTERLLVIDETGGAIRACVLEDGELVETLSGSADRPQLCGNIYLGRVLNLVPGMDAAFLDIGLERSAILSGKAEMEPSLSGKPKPKCGDEIPVQITKLPGGDKGVVVSRELKLAGKLCVLLPLSDSVGVSKRINDEQEIRRLKQLAEQLKPAGMGLIFRTSAQGESAEALQKDIGALLSDWNEIQLKASHRKAPALLRDESSILYRAARDIFCEDIKEVVFSSEKLYNIFLDHAKSLAPRLTDRVKRIETDNLFALYRIQAQLEKAAQRRVYLKSGGFIVIDRTEAMTVIDVNSGKYTGKEDAASTILKVNLEAAKEIAKQVRLRDIGGIIIVDFIDMDNKGAHKTLLDALKTDFSQDRNRTRVIDITPLGLVEMTRKKKHDTD